MVNEKSVAYGRNDLPDYVADQLNASLIPAFFPVSFVYDGNCCTGIYNTDTYKPLSIVDKIFIKDLLWIICRLMEMIAENEKHYLFGTDYQISQQTVYVDIFHRQIKMVFQPAGEAQSAKSQLSKLLHHCKNKVSEEGQAYLEDMIQYLNRDEVGLLSAIHHGEVLQNEVCVCGIQ